MFPFPYLLFGTLLAMATTFGIGWHYGQKAEKAALAAYKVEVAAAEAEWRQQVAAADTKADKAEAALRAARAKKQKAIIDTVISHAQTLPDPPECALDTARVSVINAAVEAANSADTGSKTAAVPAATPAIGGITLPSGILGSGNSGSLWGLRSVPAKPN